MVTKPVFLNDILMLENKLKKTQKAQHKSSLISVSGFCIQISKVSLYLNTGMSDTLWIPIRENEAYGELFKFWLYRLPQLPAYHPEILNFISEMLFRWHLVSNWDWCLRLLCYWQVSSVLPSRHKSTFKLFCSTLRLLEIWIGGGEVFYKVFVLFLSVLLAQLIPLSSLCQGLLSNKRGNK